MGLEEMKPLINQLSLEEKVEVIKEIMGTSG